MPTLFNNFEGGPDGTTVTTGNSNQSGTQSPFDIARVGGTGVLLQYASSDLAALSRPTAEYVLKTASGAGTATTFPTVAWTSSMGTQAEIWTRFYVYLTSTATNTNNDLGLFSTYTVANAAHGVSVALSTSGANKGQFYLYNHNTATTYTQAGLVATANTWYRIECHFLLGTSAGIADLQVFMGVNVDGDVPNVSQSVVSQNFGTTTANIFSLAEDVIYQTNQPNTYFSNWELNTTGYPGPAPFRAGLGSPSGGLTNPVAIHSDIS
jgi:hypothetical protein